MMSSMRFLCAPLCLLCASVVSPLRANPPVASYIFPAGGQRGTTVDVRVGGLFLHDKCHFKLEGKGLVASRTLIPTKRIWFEGPVIPIPDSQRAEDYPADMIGKVAIAKKADVGPRRGWLFTSQGAAGGLVLVVGDLPEVTEKEIDGEAIPESIALPVTANGRIFPRDDLDLWEFEADAGQTVTALVLAKSLNSPLVPRIGILDANDRVLAETMVRPVAGSDASIRFTAPAKGKYRVRIGDARADGGPAYVYRLTLTTAGVPDVAFPLKVKPDGLKDVTEASRTHAAPVAINGRVAKPGEASEWHVSLEMGTKYALDLQARRYDSPLCGVVTVIDQEGKELARGEAADATADPSLSFTPPADGTYTIRIAERFRGRGGPAFVYRLRIADGEQAAPDFRITVAGDKQNPSPDAVTVLRGGAFKLKLGVERTGGFVGAVQVKAVGLPKGVSFKPLTIGPKQNNATLTFEADSSAPLANSLISITGTATIDGKPIERQAIVTGNGFLAESHSLYFAVGMPAPFKIIDEFVMTSAPRGEIYRRKYRVEREPGFDGRIQVSLADRQARHLQGVTGPVVIVPPGQTEFEYPAYLPPWMELGRTCRVCVMAVGKVKDTDGTEHTVSFSGTGQNQQMIAVVGPGRLDLALKDFAVRAVAGGEARIPFSITRDRDIEGAVKVDVVIPAHWKGVTAEPVTIPSNESDGELVLRFANDCGRFNMPLTVRATLETPTTPVDAEAKVEVVR